MARARSSSNGSRQAGSGAACPDMVVCLSTQTFDERRTRRAEMADAQLCGSVNLEDAEAVFRELSKVSETLRRVPDGETGPRQQWIMAQMERFAANPDFVQTQESGFAYGSRPSFRLRDGLVPEDASFDLGYAAGATESYPLFKRLRDEGKFAPDARFQVSLPTQLAIVGVYIDPEQQAAIAP